MSNTNPLPSLAGLKDQARRLRAGLADTERAISHSRALELVAAQYGFRDWNTLHAAARANGADAARLVTLGQRVAGRYLGQPFTGAVIALKTASDPDRTRVTVQFDEAVDVVRFESFSALRKRVRCTLNADGRTAEVTSDGTPHLELTG